ncbi:hypothetical protein DEU56DRAFT_915952 [Suillus clintonianus]|uniref:uncharacterized protein n=1 Tax=Suillus clintonianus TaxID=1904413 RepID=UPI001B87D482|nr:uncharacterized protein DEU56DRAFT_915952 [Suillus clintonianus]KAG2126839.1 hypothetical protein DEU56DRAFT_915952 [Suillus clintonianus]
MSPPRNGVALYTISSSLSDKYATLLNSTIRQYVTLEDFNKEQSQQTWLVSYDAGTGIATFKNAVAEGNYATVNDLLSLIVGGKDAQEFKLIPMSETSDYFAIQEISDAGKVWYPEYIDRVEVIRARSIPHPTTNDMSLAIPAILTAPADLGSVSTTTIAQPASAVIFPSVIQSFQSPASTSMSTNTTYMLIQSLSPSAAVTSVTTIIVTDVMTTTIAIIPTSTTTVVETVTATTTVTTTSTPWGGRTAWAAPPDMTDLSAFNVTHFPSGKQNVAIIDSFSALAIVPGGSVYAHDINISQNAANSQNVTDFTAALQLVYPAYSVNPSSKSPGGAEFYATPLNLSDAQSVTMEYSVFFPADFDWVKGGKLPGLYGGHTGCSGGAAAKDCFSTRLMWRQGGAGELYLYAPKSQQTKSLCSDPQSVCDFEYGLSIGRGSFHYSRGNWTTLRQDVVLNTPGKQDGAFALFVNGMQAINRTDVFYRGAPQQKNKSKPKATSRPSTSPTPQQTQGGLLGILAVTATAQGTVASQSSIIHTAREAPTILVADRASVLSNSTSDSSDQQAVGFVGLFFSTFFGGHGDGWATPKQQYTWFKDFAITRNF